MLANIIIMALVLGYCAYVIYREVKNAKAGIHTGCGGCSGCSGCPGGCGNCGIKFKSMSDLPDREKK